MLSLLERFVTEKLLLVVHDLRHEVFDTWVVLKLWVLGFQLLDCQTSSIVSLLL